MKTTGPAPRISPLAIALSSIVAFVAALPGSRALGEGADLAAVTPLGFEELMQVRTVEGAVISADGRWVAWAETPDRGDGEGVLRATAGSPQHRVERGAAPVFSADGAWVAFRIEPSFTERERHEKTGNGSGKEKAAPPRPGLALIETATGRRIEWERVAAWAFSHDGGLLAVHHFSKDDTSERDESAEELIAPTEPFTEATAETTEETTEEQLAEAIREQLGARGEEGEQGQQGEQTETPDQEAPEGRKAGGELLVRRLASGEETRIPWVDRWAWSHNRGSDRLPRIAYSIDDPEGAVNRLATLAFGRRPSREQLLATGRWASYPALAWGRDRDRLAFLAGVEREEGEVCELELRIWNAHQEGTLLVTSDGLAGDDWVLSADRDLELDRGDDRVYFGFAPRPAEDTCAAGDEGDPEAADGEGPASADGEPIDPAHAPYDVDAILAERTVDVWHWNDPLIVPHQKQRWKEESKRSYLAVAHLEDGEAPRVVRLADRDLPEVEPTDAVWTIARSDLRHREAVTWEGAFHDLYLVSTETGQRIELAERLDTPRRLAQTISPSGRSVVFYRDGDWHLTDRDRAASEARPRNLTQGLGVGFADEDHDYPEPAPGYGLAGWIAEGEPGSARDLAVLIYDKYDLWRIPLVETGEATRLTAGREAQRIFRLVDLDRGHEDPRGFHHPGEEVLYLAYHDRAKTDSLWRGALDEPAARPLHEADRRMRVIAKAERADALLYTEESYSIFPDLWVANTALEERRRLSDANPRLADRDLGSAELVEWLSLDGEPLQGVLIKPAGYRLGERVPVLVYFYRFFSQRLHEFNEPRVNHRPSFPVYATDGYAIFLPDIRFEVGRPGLASVKSLVPGVQKLIDLGIADPDAIGLHGHSWSGYQTAFIVTQTDLFEAAVAGAPVANMTSAYSGIRWSSGMARQFQYEQSQSRIGGTLWDRLDLYIDNSPVFFADRVDTPLLIIHGDEDGAVPWYQSIELYLALRRLDKPAVFLQYRGEDHHPEKYANKLDWAIKMKEFFDHHLKGAPAPEWWSEGIPYAGQ